MDTGRVDLAIIVNPAHRDYLSNEQLVTEKVYLVGSPRPGRPDQIYLFGHQLLVGQIVPVCRVDDDREIYPPGIHAIKKII